MVTQTLWNSSGWMPGILSAGLVVRSAPASSSATANPALAPRAAVELAVRRLGVGGSEAGGGIADVLDQQVSAPIPGHALKPMKTVETQIALNSSLGDLDAALKTL